MSDKSTELEELEAFVASPGWQWFQRYAEQLWGPSAYRQQARKIMGALTVDSAADASSLLLQLESAAKAVEDLLTMPHDRIKRLRAGGQHAPTR